MRSPTITLPDFSSKTREGSKTVASYHPSAASYMDEERRLGVCVGSDWTGRSIPL